MAKYSAKQTKMRKGAKSGRHFIQLFTNVKRSEAYHGLSVLGRAAFFELIDRYNGVNNGMIVLGVRELAYELNCSPDTAARALHELDDAGLARPTKVGVWRGKRATEWRLMHKRCDKTNDLPVTNWKQRSPYSAIRPHRRSQSDPSDTKVRPIGRKASLSPTHRTQTPKNQMNGIPVSPTYRTHVYLHHRDTDSRTPEPVVSAEMQASDGFPDLPTFLDRRRAN
jgi:hypothetical protein